MDRLDEIFRMQKALNDDIIARRHLEGISDTEWIQKQTLAMLSEMDELLGMSDRIVVMSEGRKAGELSKEEFNQERILNMASGE